MSNKLIIVESPAKVKTIKKYLGSGYSVDASQGHVRDLPKSRLGIDPESDFDVDYITIRGKGELLSKLRKKVKAADKIYLATDPDREGEAISWHLINSLKLDSSDKKVYRISFNEITKNAISESIKHPREIDMNLVDAQQARRALDRLVGYKISPVLWTKVKRGLSAGRVQSVALRMIADREDEINAFVPQEYWSIEAELKNNADKRTFIAKFYGEGNRKLELKNKNQTDKILNVIKGKEFKVAEVKETDKNRKAPLPFTTSTLQQEAGKVLNFSTSKTMRTAQDLYEGVNITGKGTIALITYLRTDSVRVSDEADKSCKDYISKNFGPNYVSDEKQIIKTKGNVQDAHEAIRPTDVTLTPVMVKDSLSRDQYRLYQLIWKRFVASRMKPAVFSTKNIKIVCDKYLFTASGSKLKFEGFKSVYSASDDEEEATLPVDINEGDTPQVIGLDPQQHFTQPPAHYTESSLVKALEEEGIGRPSTYAPTITTILQRHYITKEKKNLFITELGTVVNDIMKEQFPDIVNTKFTAELESKLDDVADGNLEWKQILRDFYPEFEKEVQKANEKLEHYKVEDKVSDVKCELCGRMMVIKYGPHGKFLACPGFPDCKNTKPFLEKTGIKCPECGGDIVVRRTKKGRIYYGCENYPECEFMSWQKPKSEV